LEVAGVVGAGRYLDGHALDDLQPVAAQPDALLRVVRHETELGDAEVAEDLAADAVVAVVHLEPEGLVGLDGVHPLLLQLVGLQLVDEPDAAALLLHVEHNALPRALDLLHGPRELVAAVAPGAPEDVAGDALAVDADEDGLALAPLALDEGEVVVAREHLLVGDEPEVAVTRGH